MDVLMMALRMLESARARRGAKGSGHYALTKMEYEELSDSKSKIIVAYPLL